MKMPGYSQVHRFQQNGIKLNRFFCMHTQHAPLGISKPRITNRYMPLFGCATGSILGRQKFLDTACHMPFFELQVLQDRCRDTFVNLLKVRYASDVGVQECQCLGMQLWDHDSHTLTVPLHLLPTRSGAFLLRYH